MLECKIGEIIDSKGLRRKFIVDKLGVTSQQMSNWVNNRSYPTVDKLFKLADLLGVKVDDLYTKKDPHQ